MKSQLFIRSILVSSLFAACFLFGSSCSLAPRFNFGTNVKKNTIIRPRLTQVTDPSSESDLFELKINKLLKEKDFTEIEKLANTARNDKERHVGGYWKIDSIYDGLGSIYSEHDGKLLTDQMWQDRLALIEEWKTSSPESVTARIALAHALMGYAWFARGDGYSNTVSAEDYETFTSRVLLSADELKGAAELGVNCPRLIRDQLYIGMLQGIPFDEFNKKYTSALNVEPNYLQFHLVKSAYLNPKWNGSAEEWSKFINDLPKTLEELGSDEASLIYFIVVANSVRDPALNINWALIDNTRIKNGFEILDSKYGADNYRLNQFAFVTSLKRDLKSAKIAFERIGEARNDRVWGGPALFEQLRSEAISKNKTLGL